MSETVSAQTRQGRWIGRKTSTGAAFLGIRYAAAPVGTRRFLPPQRQARSDGPIDARTPGAAPPQLFRAKPAWAPVAPVSAISEDCLTLNVWTPAPDGARRPVLVHVFGGGFQTGSAYGGVQDAEALSAQGDIVVVRVNFRIGALGFLALGGVWGAPYGAGNLALLDLVAALEWVHENIAGLGGDPDKVTLLGLSSGAFMAAALFAMPQSGGLFGRAALQSGSASRIIAASTANAMAARFLDLCRVTPGDREGLEALDVAAILAAQDQIAAADLGERNAPGGRTLGVVLDGVMLKEHPMQAFARGDRRNLPVLIGVTRDEARLWSTLGLSSGPASEAELIAEMTRFAGEAAGRRLFAAYRGRHPDESPAALRERFLSDAVYIVPALRTAAAHAQAGGRAFLYEFAFVPAQDGGRLGAAHGFDEPFLWGVADAERVPFVRGLEDDARRLAASMSSRLIAFVREGEPGWRPVDARGFNVERFGEASPPGHDLGALIEVWRGVDRP